MAFDIDANGILNVSAKDLGTGKEQQITISGSGGLNEGEIDRMVTDAESHADEDQERRKAVEAKNRLDQLVYTTEKTLEEHKEKLGADDIGALERALEQSRKALESDELSELEAATEALTQASHKLAETMYQQTSGGDGGAGPEGGGDAGSAGGDSDDGEVIDAEYVDVEDKAS